MKESIHKKILHTVGLKATPARLRILDCFAQTTKPMSVSDIVRQLGCRAPHTVTVYRMMQNFCVKDIMRRVDFGQGVILFERAKETHHHHIVCTVCGYVEDVKECHIEHTVEKIQEESIRFDMITDHQFELFGVCKKCKK